MRGARGSTRAAAPVLALPMPLMLWTLLLLLLLLVACDRAGRTRTAADLAGATVLVQNVTVVDVEDGSHFGVHNVVVRGDSIAAILPAGAVPDALAPDATVVDGAGQYLIPGLADMHVHLYSEGDLLTYVANGITTVRNMAGDTTHLAFRRGIDSMRIIGPRIVTAGPVLETGTLSHPDNVLLRSASEVRAELVRQRKAGYDFVKVYNELDRPVYDSVIAIAREMRFPVAGHVPFAVGIDGALAAGQGSIEHLRGYLDSLVPSPLRVGTSFRQRSVGWTGVDTTRMPVLAARTARAGVWNTPTFAFTVHELSPADAHAALVARPETRHLSLAGLPTDRSKGYTSEFTDADFAATQRGLEGQFAMIRALDRAGAGLLAGTDSWLSGHALAEELELFVRAGLSPARVLRIATLDAARFLGESNRWGTIAPGRRADLVLLDADPLASIANVRRVRGVLRAGRYLSRDTLAARVARLQPARK